MDEDVLVILTSDFLEKTSALMEAARISSFSGDVTLSVWINFESEKNVAAHV